jgi:nucleolar pre-ribosomal-associated protein 1
MSLSPFTMLLKMHCDRRRTDPDCNKFERVLRQVATENHILHSQSSLEMLTLSLQDWGGFIASNKVFEFLDTCILRFVRKSIHYHDYLMSLVAAATTDISSSNSHIDLLLVTIMEQWPFLAKSADPPTITNVSSWLLRYIEMARLDGADAKVLGQICDKIQRELQDKAGRELFRKALKEPPELGLPGELAACENSKGHDHVSRPNPHIAEVTQKSHTGILQPGPPKEDENHPGLHRWSRENIQDAISGGATAELFLCLCSRYAEIRKQALYSVRTFMGELEVRIVCDNDEHSLQFVGVGIQRMAADIRSHWRARGDGSRNSFRRSPSLLCCCACSTTSFRPR